MVMVSLNEETALQLNNIVAHLQKDRVKQVTRCEGVRIAIAKYAESIRSNNRADAVESFVAPQEPKKRGRKKKSA